MTRRIGSAPEGPPLRGTRMSSRKHVRTRPPRSVDPDIVPDDVDRMKGTVTSLAHDRGFGFLRDETGQERFFHKSTCLPVEVFEELEIGDTVMFTPFEHPKGSRAIMVRK